MSNTIRVLERAAELVEQGWTQGFVARTASGNECDSYHSQACVWCAIGALERSLYETGGRSFFDAHHKLQIASGDRGMLSEWNDAPERTQAEVVAAFRRAIELAKEEAAA